MTMRFSGWKLAIFYSAPRELTPTLLRLCRAARCRHPDAVWFVSFSIQHEVNDLDTFVCVLGRRLNFERDCPELCFAGVLIQGREKDLHKAASLGHVFAMSEQFIRKRRAPKQRCLPWKRASVLAGLGDREGFFYLGLCRKNGLGKDLVRARTYFKIAALMNRCHARVGSSPRSL